MNGKRNYKKRGTALKKSCYVHTMAPPPHIHELTDISNSRDLIRYAVASQWGRLGTSLSLNQKAVAKEMGMAESAFSHALGDGTAPFDDAHLKRFDLIMSVLGLDHAGGLRALAVRLRGAHDAESRAVDPHSPASTHEELLRRLSNDEDTVLLQADALVSRLRLASRLGRSEPSARSNEINRVVSRLILIGAAPPTQRNVEALIWLGTLSGYAFDQMQDQLVEAVRTTPLGFRVWRAVTKSVLLNTVKPARGKEIRTDRATINSLRVSVRRLLKDAGTLRDKSLYPGRSLDLELAIALPGAWSAPTDEQGDWVYEVLLERAQSDSATLRERATAAHGLWQRAVQGKGRDKDTVKVQLQELIDEFEAAENRPDVATGLHWTAATLRAVIAEDVEVCNAWPENGEAWFATVMDAARDLGEDVTIPAHVRSATRKLFEHALLQNAGVPRRQAIDTIVAAGWADQVAHALSEVLKHERGESWLRIRALFALGFLQCRNRYVRDALVEACLRAAHRLSVAEPQEQSPAMVTELHAALFAVGDCFGARGAEDLARQVREPLRSTLEKLVEGGLLADEPTWPAARAAAYLLTFTAQAGRPAEPDFAQVLLGRLEHHPDPVTSELSKWALSFRFAGDGSVRPLLDAARLDAHGNLRLD
ncbi:hypothetical protein PYK79_14510 [Streptomyces sp. ID05-04B]|uniref:hypothetical protein n=1 Tax=unclassified Streptomyces TaxID=2593676 RepID=UPI000D1B8826|nr:MULTISPECIES: hypothetical protein [unclassified Streptomyces]AVV46649.1 hypothetical protein C6376_40165 [Streptomyces sp. P3]MDX5564301.1 hypothetical protein [Streptomyces sp. ID05-04B]